MACFTQRHLNKESEDFLEEVGMRLVESCAEKYSVWRCGYEDYFIPLDKTVIDLETLLQLISSSARMTGFKSGQGNALQKINKHLGDIVFRLD